MLNVSLFVNNRFTILLITSIFDFKPYFLYMWDFVYMSIYSSTNVWFGKGYVVFSDPVGDRRHFNRDDYGIWFTNMWINFFSWTGSILHRQQGTFLFYSAVGALGKCWGGGYGFVFFLLKILGKVSSPPPWIVFPL